MTTNTDDAKPEACGYELILVPATFLLRYMSQMVGPVEYLFLHFASVGLNLRTHIYHAPTNQAAKGKMALLVTDGSLMRFFTHQHSFCQAKRDNCHLGKMLPSTIVFSSNGESFLHFGC